MRQAELLARRSRFLSARSSAHRKKSPTAKRMRSRIQAASRQHSSHAFAQIGDEFALEPRIALDPAIVAPRRMRQRNESRRVFAPGCNGLRHVRLGVCTQMPILCIGSDEQYQLEIRQDFEQTGLPMPRAFLARRLVASALVIA